MKYIVSTITVFLIPVILNLLTFVASRSTTESIYYFVMKPTKAILFIGWPCTIFFMICIIGSSLGGQFKGLAAGVFSVMFIIGVILILSPVKGFYDTTVDGDLMTSSRLWVIKKTVNISDIDYCVRTRGSIDVYVQGQNKKACAIDSMSTNLRNFYERMEEEGIEIV